MLDKFFIKNLKSKGHEEGTPDDHEGHVEEEVPVVVVPNTVIEPGTVVVHLEHAVVANTAVMSSGWLRSNTLLADGGDFLQYSVRWGNTRGDGEGHQEVKDNIDEQIVTKNDQPPNKIDVLVF